MRGKNNEYNKKFWGLFHLSNYPSILVLCRCFDVWSQHSGCCSLQHREREIQRESVYAKLVCLVWSTVLISHAGCRTWSAKHQTECHRWSRFFLENQTWCLKQKRCSLIYVWCKVETVLVASFVFWRQKHKKWFATTCNKRCWKGTICLTVHGMIRQQQYVFPETMSWLLWIIHTPCCGTVFNRTTFFLSNREKSPDGTSRHVVVPLACLLAC